VASVRNPKPETETEIEIIKKKTSCICSFPLVFVFVFANAKVETVGGIMPDIDLPQPDRHVLKQKQALPPPPRHRHV
jgi:hypothetical protein